MELLLQGKPIVFDSTLYGIPGGPNIVILGGETEKDIQDELGKHVTLPDPTPDPASPQASARENCPRCLYGDCFDPDHGW